MERTFGAKVLTAWNVDTFGQTIQMPQLFRRAGLRYFFFSRDLPPAVKDSARNLFYWQSPDGSKVLAHIDNYGEGIELRAALEPGAERTETSSNPWQSLEALIRSNPAGNDKIMLPWGTDEYLPHGHLSTRLRLWFVRRRRRLAFPIKSVVMSTASRYFGDVEKSAVSLPIYTYDFNPPLLLQDLRGVWGERPEEKLAERRSEDILESSEKLSSVASLYGEPYPARDFMWAWTRILANHNHDTMGGSHADAPHDVAMSRYGGAMEVGRQAQADALFQLSRKGLTLREAALITHCWSSTPLSFPAHLRGGSLHAHLFPRNQHG